MKSNDPATSKGAGGGRVFRVFVADDDPSTLQVFRDAFDGYRGFKVVGDAQNLDEMLKKLEVTPTDLLILDIYFNRPVTGLHLIPVLREMQPAMKILVVTGMGEHNQQESFVRKANGFLAKPFPTAKLAEAVMTVLAGRLFYDDGVFLNPGFGAEAASAQGSLKLPESLTTEDREYIEARLTGKSDAQIASEKNVKMETISQRRYRISQRLELDTDIESFLFKKLRGSPASAEEPHPGDQGAGR